MGKAVIKGITMITQIGISMMVPIFLCVFLGLKLDEWLNTNFLVFVFLLLGIVTAFRNIYILTKSFYAKDKKREEEELRYYEEMKQQREKAKLKNEK